MDGQRAGLGVEVFLSLVQRCVKEQGTSERGGEAEGHGSEDETRARGGDLVDGLPETGSGIRVPRALVHEGIFIEDSVQGGSGELFHQFESGTLDGNLNRKRLKMFDSLLSLIRKEEE